MSLFTRREWTAMVAGGLVTAPLARVRAANGGAALPPSRNASADRHSLGDGGQGSRSVVAGVRIGAQTYSFRDRPIDQVPAALKAAGLSFCELWSGHVEAATVIGAVREMPRPERRE